MSLCFCQPKRCGICWERTKVPLYNSNKDILTILRILLRCLGEELISGFRFIHLLSAGIHEWLVSISLNV